jgi:tetratricopeptide (TPR) repeat protein
MDEAQAQPQATCQLNVSVRNSAGQPVRASLLLIGSGLFSRTSETGNTGETTFVLLPEDDYRLVVHLANGKQTEERVSTRNGDCLQSHIVRFGTLEEVPNGPEVFIGDLKAPNKAKRLYSRGLSELHRQHWRTAEGLFQKSVDLYPGFSGAYNALGVAASENGDFETANAAFRKAIALRKNYSEAYLNFAKSLLQQKNCAEAEGLLNEFVAINPENGFAISLLVESLFRQHKFDEVIGIVRQIHLNHRPHEVFVHRYAAAVYRQRGMMQEFQRENAAIVAESRP